jgi:ribonucleoside-triphosphate reductase
MDMLNRAFFELMLEGDADNKLFPYPIPTYNIHSRFDWDNPNNKLLWEVAGKFGTPYFANFLNSDLEISDIRSMCCRLQLSLKDLRKKNGGLFGAGDSTGSIGVCTINLPKIAYESKTKKEFYERLDYLLNIAKDSLEIKRKWLQENIIDTHAIPAFMEYVGTIKNHFSTIGDIGKNEMCLNFLGEGITSKKGHEFAKEVGEYIRKKLIAFQEETGHLYNYEATPAESTCYRLAKKDKEVYPDIITQGNGKDVYYTNSCHIPVKDIVSIDSTFKHQDELQTQYTGGTVIHIYLDGGISGEQAKSIIKSVCFNYKTPYISISPISRYCDEHGYVKELVDNCPICNSRVKKYQRITGYLRCVDNFNKGKAQEFKDRAQISSIKFGD